MLEDFDPSGLDRSPVEPSSSLPGVPRTGGHRPTTTSMLENMLQRQSGNQLATYILQADARAQAITGMMTRAIAGKNSAQWVSQNPDLHKGMNLLASTAINSGLIPGGGGNSLDMAFGIQSALGRGVRLSSGGISQSFAGRGFLNDQMTMKLFDRVQSDFYGPLGAARLQRTHGFDRGQVGQAMTALGERGAFAGLNMGELKQLANGKYDVALDEGAVAKIKNMTSNALKTVRALSDITGDPNIRRVMQTAERVSGISFADSNGAALIRSRVNNIITQAGVLGENPQAMLARIADRGGGPLATIAVTNAATAYRDKQEQRRVMMEQGIFTARPNQKEMEDVNQLGMTAILGEESEVMGAMYVAQNYRTTEEQRAGLRSHINKIAEAKTWDEKAAARAQLRAYADQEKLTGGVSLSAIARQQGGAEGVMSALDSKNAGFVADFARREDMSRLFNINIKEMTTQSRMDAIYGSKEGTMQGVMTDVFGTMDTDAQTKLMTALNKGNADEAVAAMRGASGFDSEEAKNAAIARLQGAYQQTGVTGLGAALKQGFAGMRNNPLMRNAQSAGDIAVAARERNRRRREDRKHGTGIGESGLLESMIRGVTGGENVMDLVTLQYLQNKGEAGVLSFDLVGTKDGDVIGGLNDQSMAELMKMPGLAAALGTENNAKAIQKALGTAEGTDKFTNYLEDNDYTWQGAKNANDPNKSHMIAAPSALAAAGEKAVSNQATRELLASLGADDNQITRAMGDTKAMGDLLGGKSSEILKGLADPNSKEGKGVKLLGAQKDNAAYIAQLDKMIELRQAAVDKHAAHPVASWIDHRLAGKDENGEFMQEGKSKEQLALLKRERERIAAGGDKDQGEMVMKIRCVMGDELVGELYKQRGLKN